MSFRAILIGLLGVAFITSYTYFNDHVMHQTMFVGNNMPISIYGFLVVFMILIHPLLRRISPRLSLSRTEIAVVLAITLASCAIPGSNLLRLFTPTLVLPHRYENTEPGWQKQEVMKLVPDHMLVDVAGREEVVLNGFARGLAEGNKSISVSQVPWRAWVRPLAFWLPIILSLWIALIGLAMVVHRQWAHHEHLPYPIVTFTEALLPTAEGEKSGVFNQRIFWISLLGVMSIYVYNYLCVWFPDSLMGAIPLGIDFSPLAKLSPMFLKGGGEGFLSGSGHLYFTVLAVAYFLPKDVSLSLGIGPFLWVFISGILATYGIGATGWQGQWPFGIERQGMFVMGAFFAMFLVIVYTGRHYYRMVFMRAMGLRGKEEVDRSAVWGARVFLACLGLFVVYIAVLAGVDWPVALLFALGLVGVYMVMGRIIAETGLFFIVTAGTPPTILWAFMGGKALGPEILLVMFIICLILFYDTREALMPFVVNSLKLAEDCKAGVGRTARLMALALIVGLAVGIPVTLYFQYNRGIDITAWQNQQPRQPFNEVIGVMQRLESQGQLAEAGQVHGLARFLHCAPSGNAVITFGLAVGLVLLFSFLRLRFNKWPFHPVMFLIWTSHSGISFAQSFLLGWVVKAAVMKYGGANIYQGMKPLMFGLIAGEMIGGLVPMVVSLIYYLLTGDQPKQFMIMPG